MRLVTWNVQRGLRQNQVPFLQEAAPDIIALQEISAKHLGFTTASLVQLGLPHIISTLDDDSRPAFGLALASRWHLERAAPASSVLSDGGRAICAVVESPKRATEVMTIHVPPGTRKVEGRPNPTAKIETFEALTEHYRRTATHAQVLLGDFNTPKHEFNDGTMAFFGNARQRQVEEEFYRVVGLHVLRDVFRSCNFRPEHGFQAPAKSWQNSGRRDTSQPRRFDHVFASPELQPVSAIYPDAARIWGDRISDHLPLTVELRWEASA